MNSTRACSAKDMQRLRLNTVTGTDTTEKQRGPHRVKDFTSRALWLEQFCGMEAFICQRAHEDSLSKRGVLKVIAKKRSVFLKCLELELNDGSTRSSEKSA